MIDSHCHIDSPRFDADREAVLARARAAGVTALIAPSVGPEAWEPLLAWTRARAGTHAALGIHPQLLPDLDPKDDERHLAALESVLERGGAVAIGECGLDGPSSARAPMERQVAVLRAHLALARRFRLPVLLHCLRAHEPMLRLLSEERLEAGGVMHSYSGSGEQVRDYLPHGLHFSLAGPITYERARKPAAAARAIPAERLLVETDAPDQTPRPHTGRCEPAYLREVVRGVALARGVAEEEIAALTEANARRLFRLGG